MEIDDFFERVKSLLSAYGYAPQVVTMEGQPVQEEGSEMGCEVYECVVIPLGLDPHASPLLYLRPCKTNSVSWHAGVRPIAAIDTLVECMHEVGLEVALCPPLGEVAYSSDALTDHVLFQLVFRLATMLMLEEAYQDASD